MRYVYPAKIIVETEGYTVYFPNVEGAVAQGDNLFEVLKLAEDSLSEILIAYENYKAGRVKEMKNNISEPAEDINAPLIKVDTDTYRENPSAEIELWYSPDTKKYFTMMRNDDVEIKATAEKMFREISGTV